MSTRQRALLSSLAALALVVAVVVVASGGEDDGDDELVAGDASSTTTSSSSTTATTERASTSTTGPAPAPTTTSAPATTTTTAASGPVQLEVRLDRTTVTAGERVVVDVVARNRSDAEVWWQAGGCAIAFSGGLLVTGEPSPEPDWGNWDGDVDGLADHLAEHNAEPADRPLQDERFTGVRFGPACNAASIPAAIPPGGERAERHSIEVRLLPGAPQPSNAVVRVQFDGYADRELTTPLGPFVADTPLTVEEHDARPGTERAAVDAFAADERLEAWVDETRAIDPPATVTQSWYAAMSWWRGAWELWVTPYYETCDSLRLRYDPTLRRVADARTVPCGEAVADP